MEDKKIVDLYWERSEIAIEETGKKYGKYCFHIASNILRSDTEAEECVNDTYMQLWNSIPPSRPMRFSSFVGRITRNLALNRYTRARAMKRNAGVELIFDEVAELIPDRVRGGECITEKIALTEAINLFLGTLSKRARIIFVKRYWYMCSIEEIAEDIGTTRTSVKVSLHRTRAALKSFLEEREIQI